MYVSRLGDSLRVHRGRKRRARVLARQRPPTRRPVTSREKLSVERDCSFTRQRIVVPVGMARRRPVSLASSKPRRNTVLVRDTDVTSGEVVSGWGWGWGWGCGCGSTPVMRATFFAVSSETHSVLLAPVVMCRGPEVALSPPSVEYCPSVVSRPRLWPENCADQ